MAEIKVKLTFLFFLTGQHLTEEIESLNPFKKVPFIEDKGTVLIERLLFSKILQI